MATLLPYDPVVRVIWATPNPVTVVTHACSVTQKGVFSSEVKANAPLIEYLYGAEHGNPLEHAVICMEITQISRACADQLRTHRIASWTMSSTHYQNHYEYLHRLPLSLVNASGTGTYTTYIAVRQAISTAMLNYKQLIDNGVLIEHARQVLPFSTEVKMMLTINARSLAHLLSLRMCYRNTDETVLAAEAMWRVANNWFPQLFNWCVRRDCEYKGCKQGKMQCNRSERAEEMMQYNHYQDGQDEENQQR